MQSRISIAGSMQWIATQSNHDMGNNDMILEHHHCPPGEMAVRYDRQHVFSFNSGGAAKIERCVAGRGQHYIMVPDMMSFYPRDVPFRYAWEQPFDVLRVGFAPAFFENVALETCERKIDLPPLKEAAPPQIRYLARALEAELRQGKNADRLYQESVGVALIVCLHRYSKQAGPGQTEIRGPRRNIRRAMDYIRAHAGSDLSLKDIADVACMSRYHFSRSFKSSTGISPHQYVLRARIEQARDLLLAGKLSLSEIAFQTGFYDQSHLTLHFKRHYGLSPGAFAARMR